MMKKNLCLVIFLVVGHFLIAQNDFYIHNHFDKKDVGKIREVLKRNNELLNIGDVIPRLEKEVNCNQDPKESRLVKLLNKVLPEKYREIKINKNATCLKLGMVHTDSFSSLYFYKVVDTTHYYTIEKTERSYLIVFQITSNNESACHLLIYNYSGYDIDKIGYHTRWYATLSFGLSDFFLQLDATKYLIDHMGKWKDSYTKIYFGNLIFLSEYNGFE